jgi:hypothetical protein
MTHCTVVGFATVRCKFAAFWDTTPTGLESSIRVVCVCVCLKIYNFYLFNCISISNKSRILSSIFHVTF